VCAGPLFARQEIKRILVVKLDHLGDFLTSVPALQRLRELFPHAHVTMLCCKAVGDFARAMGAVDAFIAFEFFHARSSLGVMALGTDDFTKLQARLEPEEFDLAIDLRKHLETRELLRYTGARFLAGYNSMGRFDWLDIALEWAVDQSMQAKLNHVRDDLLNLVEAIATASSPDCGESLLVTAKRDEGRAFLPRETQHLLERPVVCVHPGVGSAMRQWPPRHFAQLIDMFVANCGVSVVLIGGPDEQDIAEQILASVAEPATVCSLVGRVRLTDLPAVIAACELFVGNDSGPKHMAAALGVPTIGIHSGSVDATEWAPLGKRAVAIRRKMTCSPCYLVSPEDCHRRLECLTGLEPAVVFAACMRYLGFTFVKH
jgi:ADP-heptose:LPS heptosyltransferase